MELTPAQYERIAPLLPRPRAQPVRVEVPGRMRRQASHGCADARTAVAFVRPRQRTRCPTRPASCGSSRLSRQTGRPRAWLATVKTRNPVGWQPVPASCPWCLQKAAVSLPGSTTGNGTGDAARSNACSGDSGLPPGLPALRPARGHVPRVRRSCVRHRCTA